MVSPIRFLWVIKLWLFCLAGSACGEERPINESAIRIACVGDSITFGAGIANRREDSYPAQLQRMLGDDFYVGNFGVNAATLLSKGDLPYREQNAFAEAKAFKPDIVVIKLGTNDTKAQNWEHSAEFSHDAETLIREFQNLPSQPEVLVCLPVPAFPERWGIRDDLLTSEILPRWKAVAEKLKLTVIDLNTPLRDKAEWFPDQIHPNEDGAKVIAETVAKQIQAVSLASRENHRPTFILRSPLNHSRDVFEKTGAGRVAFLGGSITEMNGYTQYIEDYLKEQFPNAELQFLNAGVASTCSTTGAFRLGSDVIKETPPDLLFVEFAVNDDQDAMHDREASIRGMEGIIRQARRANPKMDIIITYFLNPSMLETLQKGEESLSIASHRAVAEHYQIPTIELAQTVAHRINEGVLTWETYGGTHPSPEGHRLCADLIEECLEEAWKTDEAPVPHPEPAKTLSESNYGNGRFVSVDQAQTDDDWELGIPAWEELPGGKRDRFASLELLSSDRPGATLTLDFEGRAIGAYILAGPDAGIAEVSVDGGPYEKVDFYHSFSEGLHYPRTVMFAHGLEPGPHRLSLRVSEDSSKQGHALRMMHFVAN